MSYLQTKYLRNLKIQTIQDQIKNVGHEYWIQIYSSLFWIISVLVNHWRLQQNGKKRKRNETNQTITEHARESIPEKNTMVKKKTIKQSSVHKSATHSQQRRPRQHSFSSAQRQPICLNRLLKEDKTRSSNNNKPSLFPLKTYVFAWKPRKRRCSTSSSSNSNNSKKPSSLLRRLSNSSATNSDSSSNSRKSSMIAESPTTKSILKSFSFKLKRQQSDTALLTVDTNGQLKTRISLSTFRRKTLPDIHHQ
ncbi:MAG: hypothetical protein EXX96DRAFT_554401 [Benjaminiella poitrasii]|nr:MAG: hypothetical protein EXX96DRAFT_554401 [Benjaminiella poitrasii]